MCLALTVELVLVVVDSLDEGAVAHVAADDRDVLLDERGVALHAKATADQAHPDRGLGLAHQKKAEVNRLFHNPDEVRMAAYCLEHRVDRVEGTFADTSLEAHMPLEAAGLRAPRLRTEGRRTLALRDVLAMNFYKGCSDYKARVALV